jgi:hypothetical protein
MNRNLNTGITKIKFKNSHIVYENFIKCTVKDYEYNLSFNPTLLSGSQGVLTPYSASNGGGIVYINSGSNYGILKNFTTGSISGSEFSPYVGAIGLYNDGGDLLAIGKMAAPIPLSANTDTTFVIKYDTQWLRKPYFTPSPSPTVTPFPTPSITPTISVTPTPSTSQIDCGIGTATAVFVSNPTPSVTPTVSVSPTISVTPSVTPSRPNVTVTPTPTPSPSIQASNVTLTFADYDSLSGFSFTLSNPINVPLTVKASVQGYINTGCTRGNGSDIDSTLTTIPTYTLIHLSAGTTPLSNNPNVFRYIRNNSMDVNGYVVSNGSVITVNGVRITIIINTACANYI